MIYLVAILKVSQKDDVATELCFCLCRAGKEKWIVFDSSIKSDTSVKRKKSRNRGVVKKALNIILNHFEGLNICRELGSVRVGYKDHGAVNFMCR